MNFEKELISRIEQMESDENQVKQMSKKDYIQLGVIAFVCLVGIIIGAFL